MTSYDFLVPPVRIELPASALSETDSPPGISVAANMAYGVAVESVDHDTHLGNLYAIDLFSACDDLFAYY